MLLPTADAPQGGEQADGKQDIGCDWVEIAEHAKVRTG